MTAAEPLGSGEVDPTVLIPIGMPLGLQHPDRTPRTVFRVRRDRTVHVLDDDQLGAWFLARTMRHDRVSLTAALAADGVADPIAAIESLVTGGLILPTAVSAEGALVLAAGHRLVPLMTGLGQDPVHGCIVGVPGVVEHAVGTVFYQVFSRATSSSSMLEAMIGVVRDDPEAPSLERTAARFLGELAEPLARGVVAIDKAAAA